MERTSGDLLSVHSVQSMTAEALNICVLSHNLREFSFTRKKPRAIINKITKCKVTGMWGNGEEKSLSFKTRETWVQIPAPPLTSHVTWDNLPDLFLSQVHL